MDDVKVMGSIIFVFVLAISIIIALIIAGIHISNEGETKKMQECNNILKYSIPHDAFPEYLACLSSFNYIPSNNLEAIIELREEYNSP